MLQKVKKGPKEGGISAENQKDHNSECGLFDKRGGGHIAKLSLNSTQLQLKLRLGLALFPTSPPTHPEQEITHDYFKIIR